MSKVFKSHYRNIVSLSIIDILEVAKFVCIKAHTQNDLNCFETFQNGLLWFYVSVIELASCYRLTWIGLNISLVLSGPGCFKTHFLLNGFQWKWLPDGGPAPLCTSQDALAPSRLLGQSARNFKPLWQMLAGEGRSHVWVIEESSRVCDPTERQLCFHCLALSVDPNLSLCFVYRPWLWTPCIRERKFKRARTHARTHNWKH